MKKMIMFIPILVIAITLGSCSKIKNLANINVDLPYSDQVSFPSVQGFTGGETLPAGGLELPAITTGFATNAQTYLTEYNTSADKIVNVDLKSMSLTIVSPPGQNFNFLDSIQIYVSTSSLPQMLVASANNIPQGTDSLILTTNTNVNLKNYFLADSLYITMTAHVNAIPATGETINISTVFHMLANPLD